MCLAVVVPLGRFISQQVTDPSGLDFRQLGIAAVICALLLADDLTQRKSQRALQDRCSMLQTKMTEREKEVADTVVPLLTRTADLLLSVTTGRMEQSVDQELVKAVERLSRTVEKFDKDH